MNVIYFALCCILIFTTLRRLFKGYGPWVSFLAAALFLVHPVHVEVVANIKSRDEILALIFSLLALDFFLRHFDSRKWLPLVGSGAFILLAFLCKEGSLAYLGVLPVAVIIFRKGDLKTYLTSSLPLIGVFSAAAIIAWLTFPDTSNPTAPEGGPEYYLESMMLNNSLFTLNSFGDHLGNGLALFYLYIKLYFFPYPLVYFSGYNQVPALSGFNWQPIIGSIAIIAGLGFAFWKMKRYPLISFSILYLLGTIFLYLQIFFTLTDTFANRFLFAPSLGLSIFLLAVVGALLKVDFKQPLAPVFALKPAPTTKKAKGKSKRTANKAKSVKVGTKTYVFAAIIAVSLIGFLSATILRNPAWKDNYTLFSTDLEHLDASAKAHFYYADVLSSSYDTASNQAQLQTEILKHYRRSIEISDSSYYSFLGLADACIRFGRYSEALGPIEKATQLFPRQGDPWFFLGKTKFFLEDYAGAIPALENSKEFNPYPTETWFLLGLSYSRNRQYAEAEAVLTQAQAKYPNANEIDNALTECYFESQRFEESFSLLATLINREPQNPDYWRSMIGRYVAIQDTQQANYWYQEALRNGVPIN